MGGLRSDRKGERYRERRKKTNKVRKLKREREMGGRKKTIGR